MEKKLFKEIDFNNNINIIRYILCVIVIVIHVGTLADIHIPFEDYKLGDILLGGFFTLSGYLIFGSYQKKSITKYYLSRRFRRILPPYFLIVLLCAFGLVLVSNLSWKEYFTNKGFYEYLAANLSFLNFLHPSLPGVFEGSKFYESAVNGSLWTMKGEWVCYLSVPFIFNYIHNKKNKALILFSTLVVLSILLRYIFQQKGIATGKGLYFTIEKQFKCIFVFFFIGAIINILEEYFFKYKYYLFIFSIILTCFYNFYALLYDLVFYPFVISIIVMFLATTGKWGYFLKNKNDLSYDMYLFHYPIIQLTVLWNMKYMMPNIVYIILVLIITFLFANVSWKLVGSKFMMKKKNVDKCKKNIQQVSNK